MPQFPWIVRMLPEAERSAAQSGTSKSQPLASDAGRSASGDFPSTHWSVVQEAGIDGSPESMAAMNVFIRLYWKPIFYFLRARRLSADRAEDLTQEFMLRLMEQDWLRRADEDRGRFRNFILRVLMRFVADQCPERTTRQKGFEGQLTPISSLIRDNDRSFEPAANLTPEEIFDRRWAMSLVQSVRELMQLSYEAEGKSNWYEIFMARQMPEPGQARASERELAARFGLSRDQVRHAQEQTKGRFMQLLRAEVRGQMGDEDLDAAVIEVLQQAARHVSSD